jgi:hypothetical protein
MSIQAATRRGVVRALVAAALCAAPALTAAPAAAADKQIRPFIGSTFAGSTTFPDFDHVAGKSNVVVGVSLVTLGEVFGVDIDVADAPGYFEGGPHLVLSSRVTTLTGNVIVAAPRRLTEYVLRPYAVGGAGLMRVHEEDYFGAFQVNRVLPAFDAGAGVLAFLNKTVGVTLEVRRFQSFSQPSNDPGLTLSGSERLSFWRAGLAVAIRY